jgi:hypothetical protein
VPAGLLRRDPGPRRHGLRRGKPASPSTIAMRASSPFTKAPPASRPTIWWVAKCCAKTARRCAS